MVPADFAARKAFIAANTRLQRPPHAPEIALYLADEITPIWRMTEEALGQMGVPPPFWAVAWAGGQGVARYVMDYRHEVANRTVLDMATGSGLVAIAAMKAGAKSALGADVDGFCEAAVALNTAANGVAVAFTSEILLDAAPPSVDLILAGDIAYEKPMADRMFAWLAAAHAAGTRVIVGDPGRSYFPRDGLVRLAEYQVPTTRELEDMEVKRTGVWSFPA